MASGKIDDYEFKQFGQEMVDFKDQVRNSINFGKTAIQVLTAAPTFTGRRGQLVASVNGTAGTLYLSTKDLGSTWATVATFTAQT